MNKSIKYQSIYELYKHAGVKIRAGKDLTFPLHHCGLEGLLRPLEYVAILTLHIIAFQYAHTFY